MILIQPQLVEQVQEAVRKEAKALEAFGKMLEAATIIGELRMPQLQNKVSAASKQLYDLANTLGTLTITGGRTK